MEVLASAAVVLELGLLTAAGLQLQLNRGYGLSGSLAISVTATMALLSLIVQAAFLIGMPAATLPLELCALACAVWLLWRGGGEAFARLFHDVRQAISVYPIAVTVLMAATAYLAAEAFLLPEGNQDSMRYNLARVLLFEQQKSLFLKKVTELHQALFPVGGDILAHLFLRFHTDYGVALFSLLAWLSIAAACYAMARRYASVGAAFTAMLVIASLPELLFQATGTKPDLIAAAVAASCLLLLRRLLGRGRTGSLMLLLLLLGFGVSAKTTFIAFALPFATVAGYLLLHRYGMESCRLKLSASRYHLLAVLIPVVVLSQGWLFLHNMKVWGGWSGPTWFVGMHINHDGLWGMVANLVRYLFQCLDLLMPVDQFAEKVAGGSVSGWLHGIYASVFMPLFGNAGVAPLALGQNGVHPFAIIWQPNESGSWFGPLAFFLILPALLYALIRGSLFLRLCSLLLFSYGVILSYGIGWMPWNSRFFSLLFACSGGALGLLLERLRGWKWIDPALRTLAVLILIYACCFNQQKPLIRFLTLHPVAMVKGIIDYNIWRDTDWGRDRQYYTRKFYGDDRVHRFDSLVEPGKRVGVTSQGIVWLYPYMESRPDLDFVLEGSGGRRRKEAPAVPGSVDYLLCINTRCEKERGKVHASLLWQDSGGSGVRRGSLSVVAAQHSLQGTP